MSDESKYTEADWRMLDRYLSGECAGEELAEARRRWGVTIPGQVRQELSARRQMAPDRVANAWSTVRSGMKPSAGVTHIAPWRRRSWQVAAAIIVIAGSASVIRLVSYRAPAAEPDRVAFIDERTSVGERRTFPLADGTRVTLGPQSHLRIPADFKARARSVELTGEAYFSVAHDESRVFSVRAGRATVRVLGTEFSVRALTDAGPVRVVVAAGRVRVDAGADSLGAILTAGRMGVLREGGRVETGDVVAAEALGWRDGRLHLDGVSLADAIAELARWYPDSVVVADRALLTRTVTADLTLENFRSLEPALEAVTMSLGARVERQGGTLVVRGP